MPHDSGDNIRNVVISANKYNGNDNLYKVIISISWEGYRGVNQDITLTTLIANKTNTTATTTPVVPVIVVSPPGTRIEINSTQQFTAEITNGTLSPSTINWHVLEHGGGTITSAGLYSAPGTAGIYHITAVSEADPTVFTTIVVNVYVNIGTVTINEVNPDIDPLSTKQFTVTVANLSPSTVTWRVLESGGGTISSSGLYTAPATPGSYTIVATSTANPSISNTTTVIVHILNIEITTPSSLTANLKKSKAIALQVTPAVPCTWSVTGGGSFPDPYVGLYYSPSTTGIQVTVTATSISNPTKTATRVFTITSSGYF